MVICFGYSISLLACYLKIPFVGFGIIIKSLKLLLFLIKLLCTISLLEPPFALELFNLAPPVLAGVIASALLACP